MRQLLLLQWFACDCNSDQWEMLNASAVRAAAPWWAVVRKCCCNLSVQASVHGVQCSWQCILNAVHHLCLVSFHTAFKPAQVDKYVRERGLPCNLRNVQVMCVVLNTVLKCTSCCASCILWS